MTGIGRDRRGFSLIEVLVALAVGAVVVGLADAVVSATAGRAVAVVAARAALDRAMNGRRWLRAAFLSVDMGLDTALTFDGHPDRVGFSTRIQTGEGGFARRIVTLACVKRRFVATSAPDDPIVFGDGVDSVAFDYLLEPGEDARWVREWVSPLRAPLAVRLRVHAWDGMAGGGRVRQVDTLLLLVKERG